MTEKHGLALDWLEDFRGADAFGALPAAARAELEFAVRVFDRAYAESPAGLEKRSLDTIKSAQVIDILAVQIPKAVSANDPGPVLDALVGFLVWAVKTGRIPDRGVEFGCRKVRAEAETTMRDERRWSPGKTLVSLAMRDGVDPSDLEKLRAHAVSRGMKSAAIDSSLPPPPVTLGNGRWLYI